MNAEKIHCFEEAGLGKAPFRFVGIESAGDRAAVNAERAADGLCYTTNNATSCDYCGMGILNAYCVASADGKRFKVGCDCIRKTGDKGLIRYVEEEESNKRREKSRAKRVSKYEHENAMIDKFRAGGAESLRLLPHPKGRDGSAWDYVAWCVENHFVGAMVIKLIEGAN